MQQSHQQPPSSLVNCPAFGRAPALRAYSPVSPCRSPAHTPRTCSRDSGTARASGAPHISRSKMDSAGSDFRNSSTPPKSNCDPVPHARSYDRSAYSRSVPNQRPCHQPPRRGAPPALRAPPQLDGIRTTVPTSPHSQDRRPHHREMAARQPPAPSKIREPYRFQNACAIFSISVSCGTVRPSPVCPHFPELPVLRSRPSSRTLARTVAAAR